MTPQDIQTLEAARDQLAILIRNQSFPIRMPVQITIDALNKIIEAAKEKKE